MVLEKYRCYLGSHLPILKLLGCIGLHIWVLDPVTEAGLGDIDHSFEFNFHFIDVDQATVR